MRVWVLFFSSRRRHARYWRDWSSDVYSSDLPGEVLERPGVLLLQASVARSASHPVCCGRQPSWVFAFAVSMITGRVNASTHSAAGGRNGTRVTARAASSAGAGGTDTGGGERKRGGGGKRGGSRGWRYI